MTNSTIKHGLRKNLPIDTIYNSQAAAIIVALGFAFKLSSAPGIFSEAFGSATFWVFMGFTAIEGICVIFIFVFARMGGDALLRATNCIFYKAACLVACVWLSAKTVFYFCYCTSYLTHELFTGTQPFLIYVLFLFPIVYLGLKGTRSIARSCELFAPLFLAVVILNLAFLDSDMDFGRNLPVFATEPSVLFATMPRYGLWLGDLFPFIFVRIRNKKAPYLTLGIASAWAIANLIVLIGVALYGNALKTVSDLFIHIASFNQLSLVIGRMEWTNLFAIIMMSLYSLAFLYDGANQACERALGTALPSKILCPSAVICSALFSSSLQQVSDFALGVTGYVLTAIAFALPISLFAVAKVEKKKNSGLYACLDAEYATIGKQSNAPDSENDGVLCSFKQNSPEGEAQ